MCYILWYIAMICIKHHTQLVYNWNRSTRMQCCTRYRSLRISSPSLHFQRKKTGAGPYIKPVVPMQRDSIRCFPLTYFFDVSVLNRSIQFQVLCSAFLCYPYYFLCKPWCPRTPVTPRPASKLLIRAIAWKAAVCWFEAVQFCSLVVQSQA